MVAMTGDFSVFEPRQRGALTSTFAAFRRHLPAGVVEIAWGMPSIKVDGSAVISLWGFQRHNSVFPGPGVIAQLQPRLDDYTVTKGTIHFDRDNPLPGDLTADIARVCIEMVNAKYPKKDGRFRRYYPSGQIAESGRIRDGQRVGVWTVNLEDGQSRTTRYS